MEISLRQIGRHIVLSGKAAHSDVPDARAVLMAGLDCGSGAYSVNVEHERWGAARAETTLGESCYLGVLRLAAGAAGASAQHRH